MHHLPVFQDLTLVRRDSTPINRFINMRRNGTDTSIGYRDKHAASMRRLSNYWAALFRTWGDLESEMPTRRRLIAHADRRRTRCHRIFVTVVEAATGFAAVSKGSTVRIETKSNLAGQIIKKIAAAKGIVFGEGNSVRRAIRKCVS